MNLENYSGETETGVLYRTQGNPKFSVQYEFVLHWDKN
jgi:hypothetical protein